MQFSHVAVSSFPRPFASTKLKGVACTPMNGSSVQQKKLRVFRNSCQNAVISICIGHQLFGMLPQSFPKKIVHGFFTRFSLSSSQNLASILSIILPHKALLLPKRTSLQSKPLHFVWSCNPRGPLFPDSNSIQIH